MKKALIMIAFALSLLGGVQGFLTSCAGEVVNEYSNINCYFIFDNQYNEHSSSPLIGSLNSPNNFCMVTTEMKEVGYIVKVTPYGGETHSEPIITNKETMQKRQLGLSGQLVVGRSSLQDGALYVFDRQCPNCYNTNHTTKYPLQWAANGTQLTCKSCNRYYGLLNGGVVVQGDNGEKLFRYRASFSNGVFIISNP